MNKLLSLLMLFSIISCNEKQSQLTADEIVDQAIINACHGNCGQVAIEFDFRGRHYVSYKDNGNFQYERITTDSVGIIRDVLHNKGFNRYINDTLVQLPDSMKVKYANSVNGVHYFAQLPYGLQDPAVQKKLIGTSVIRGNPYYKIEVTFDQEAGGKDHEDVFVYWIHQKSFHVDYFSYRYYTDEGGIRFREAYNPREIEGIRFVDYNNYKIGDLTFPLKQLDSLFEKGELELLSKIETENVRVTLGVRGPF
jgi:uncharacterized protein YajQ (UPF0234 family)